MKTLNEIPIGKSCIVYDLLIDTVERRRMLDLGIVKNTKIDVLYKSPVGDPTAYYIRGAVIALRSEDASKILVNIIEED